MLAQVLINGLILGGLYASIAVGFSLVWGVLNIINLLHGTLVVLGGYLAWLAWRHFGLHPVLAAPLVGLVVGLLGAALQAGLLNPVVGAPVLITLVVTFGLNLITGNVLLLAFGADYRTIRPSQSLGTAIIAGLRVPLDRAMAAVVALLMIGGLVAAAAKILARPSDRGGTDGPGCGGADGGARAIRLHRHLRTGRRASPGPRARCSVWCSRFPRCSRKRISAPRSPSASLAAWAAWSAPPPAAWRSVWWRVSPVFGWDRRTRRSSPWCC